MSGQVWVTDAMVSLSMTYNFAPSETYFDENLVKERSSEAKYMKAQRLEPTERRPNEAELLRVRRTVDPLPHLVSNGYLIVSVVFRDTALQFDLGSTAFDPVTLYGFQRKKRFEPDYSYLNITETKESVDLMQCNGLTFFTDNDWSFECPGSKIVLEKTALAGVDLWMEPVLHGAVFMSDRLYTALKEKGFLENLRFTKCQQA